VAFEQATIKVENEAVFAELKGSIARAFRQESAGNFLKRVQNASFRVRHLEPILEKGILEKVDRELARSGKTGWGLYQALPVSDQAQIREFYLSKLEEVDAALRTRFRKLYQYY
jgi:hypothetical protein